MERYRREGLLFVLQKRILVVALQLFEAPNFQHPSIRGALWLPLRQFPFPPSHTKLPHGS